MSERSDNRLQNRIVWGLVLGVVIYAAIALSLDARSLLDHLVSFDPRVFLGALALSLANYAVRFTKWHYYLRRLGLNVPLGESFIVFLAGFVMSVTPGKVGEVLKSLLLRQSRQIPAARTAPIVIAERVTDLFGLFVLAAFGIAFFDYGRWIFWSALAALAAFILVLQRPSFVGACLDLMQRLPLLGPLRPKLEEAYASIRELLGLRVLTTTTIISVVSWSMEALAFFWILKTLGADGATVTLAFFVYSMTTILGALSFLPGGLGVTEASMIGVLMLFGVFDSEPPAAAATYLIRFATLWFGVVVGFFALLAFRARYTGRSESS